MVKTLLRLSFVAAVSALLVACQTLGVAPLLVSTVTAQLPDAASRAIASDMAAQLKMQLGVNLGSIRLKGEGSAFEKALERALRDQGFAVGNEESLPQNPLPTDLAYTLEGDDTSILVRLSMDDLELTRIYRAAADGVVPVGPVGVLRRGPELNG